MHMNRDGDLGIPVPDYVEENVSTKVVKIIQSYTGVVDKMVWEKVVRSQTPTNCAVFSGYDETAGKFHNIGRRDA